MLPTRVSIIIPTYTHDVFPCLDSVFRYTDGCEVIVVANGCTDEKILKLRAYPGIRLIESPQPLGFAGAVNIGIKNSTGEFVVLLNDDTILLPQEKDTWIRKLISPFADEKAAVSGPLYSFSPSVGRNFIIFFCAMIRKSVFGVIGYLDETFNPGAGEDTDFCIRAENAGFKVISATVGETREENGLMVGDFPIYHKGEATVGKLPGWIDTFKRNTDILSDRYGLKLSGAKSIDGYMLDAELAFLAVAARTKGVIIEVGSWAGRSTRALADNTDGIIYAVDHWKGSSAEPHMMAVAGQNNGEYIFEEFSRNLSDHVRRGKVIPMRMASHEASIELRDRGIKADMIFIDGGHEYAEVRDDILSYLPLLKPGGLMCGHDYMQQAWPGVKRAVDEVAPGATVVPNTSIWRRPPHVLCFVPTKGRYETTLPMTLASVLMQTLPPDRLVIYDDGEKRDLREINTFRNLFTMADAKGIQWEVIFGDGGGQHRGHQISQEMATDFVWRVDDDEIAEPDVLEKLLAEMGDRVGAVGGAVIVPGTMGVPCLGKITEVGLPSPQWARIEKRMEVEHLHSSFLYRKGVANYEMSLSPVAHREETIFSHEIFRAGYKLILVPAVTWHLRNSEGGIRSHGNAALWAHDEEIFRKKLAEWNVQSMGKLIYLDCGLGDTIVFASLVPELLRKYGKLYVANCYPYVFDGDVESLSLEQGKAMGVVPEEHNIYKWAWDRDWKTELVDAYRGMYL